MSVREYLSSLVNSGSEFRHGNTSRQNVNFKLSVYRRESMLTVRSQ